MDVREKLVVSSDYCVFSGPESWGELYGGKANKVELFSWPWMGFLGVELWRRAGVFVDGLHTELGVPLGRDRRGWRDAVVVGMANLALGDVVEGISFAQAKNIRRIVAHVGAVSDKFNSIVEALNENRDVLLGVEGDVVLEAGLGMATCLADQVNQRLGDHRAHVVGDFGHHAFGIGQVDNPDGAILEYVKDMYKVIETCPGIVHAALNCGGDMASLRIIGLGNEAKCALGRLVREPRILGAVVEIQSRVLFPWQNTPAYRSDVCESLRIVKEIFSD